MRQCDLSHHRGGSPSNTSDMVNNILASIDEEIVRLKQARTLLSNIKATGALEQAKGPVLVNLVKKHRMSAAGRARIAAAQKKRWAAWRKAA